MAPSAAPPSPPVPPPDPLELLRSRSYVQLLLLAALIGAPVSAVAYGFLKLVAVVQEAVFESLPEALGFDAAPTWWPLPVLALSGLLTACAIRYLPGRGGHSPADGFHTSGPWPAEAVPGVLLAALATLSFGVVLGPEAPLILIGSGLGVLAVRLAARDAPPTAAAVISAAGSFAAISSLLGSPLLGAFLLLEASGLGGPMLRRRARPRAPGRRDRHAHLRRPGLADGVRDVLARDPGPAAVRPPDRRDVRLRDRVRAGGAVPRPRHPRCSPWPSARASSRACCC